MTKDEILSMAGQVDAVTQVLLERKEHQGMNHETFVWFLERFAALVAEKERELCAKVCDDLPAPDVYSDTDKSMWDVTCVDCAEAIRDRGQK